jgi:hypothetical protein
MSQPSIARCWTLTLRATALKQSALPRGAWRERDFIMQTLTLTLTASDCAEAVGDRTDSWTCIDCGFNTAPGIPGKERTERAIAACGSITAKIDENSEAYIVRSRVWEAANMDGWGGCLCIGCLEKRLGRTLVSRDFDRKHPFNSWPGTARLLSRRDGDHDVTARN